jgi:hypothetical protein
MDAGLPAALVGAPCRVLILFAQNRKGVPNCRKNRMAFDAGRPQENLRRKPRLLQTLEAGSSTRFLGQARRGQSQAGKADCGGVSVPELSPGPPDEPDDTDECAADGQQAGGNRE